MMLRANGSLGVTSVVVIAAALTAAPAIFHARTLFFEGKSPFATALAMLQGEGDGEAPGDLRVGRDAVEGQERSVPSLTPEIAPGQVRLPARTDKVSPAKPSEVAPSLLSSALGNAPETPVGSARSFGMKGNLGPAAQQGGMAVPPLSRIGMIAAYASAMRDHDLEGAARALAQASNRSLSTDAVQALNAKLGVEADEADVAAVVARATVIQASGNGSP